MTSVFLGKSHIRERISFCAHRARKPPKRPISPTAAGTPRDLQSRRNCPEPFDCPAGCRLAGGHLACTIPQPQSPTKIHDEGQPDNQPNVNGAADTVAEQEMLDANVNRLLQVIRMVARARQRTA